MHILQECMLLRLPVTNALMSQQTPCNLFSSRFILSQACHHEQAVRNGRGWQGQGQNDDALRVYLAQTAGRYSCSGYTGH